jgi:hypothetical protein
MKWYIIICKCHIYQSWHAGLLLSQVLNIFVEWRRQQRQRQRQRSAQAGHRDLICVINTCNLAPTAAECSPAEPRGCSWKLSRISSSFATSLLSSGRQITTKARRSRPVPRLEVQVPRNPRFSVNMNLPPSDSIEFLMAWEILQNLAKTCLTSPSVDMEHAYGRGGGV